MRRLLVVAKKRELIEAVPEIEWLKAPKPDFDFLTFDEAARLVAAPTRSGRSCRSRATAVCCGAPVAGRNEVVGSGGKTDPHSNHRRSLTVASTSAGAS